MRMSDIVARHILDMLELQNGNIEIQRNELAGTLGCVPSQINYVISSRFTPEHGYIIESRRGGGGYGDCVLFVVVHFKSVRLVVRARNECYSRYYMPSKSFF